jgi:ubiquinone/menaquinone biosynthesis C-methylase UbiE
MDYYDEISAGYEQLHGEEQLRKAKIILQNLEVRKTDKLLDVGCGTASYLSIFKCQKTGIDPSKELLKQAKIPTVQGKAEELPFPDNSFDIVISLTAIHHANPKKAVAEMFRVAKRYIVISVLKKASNFSEIEKEISRLNVKRRVEELHDVIFFVSKV